MAKGVAKKRDIIHQGGTKRADETDTLSPVDKGKDFVPAGVNP